MAFEEEVLNNVMNLRAKHQPVTHLFPPAPVIGGIRLIVSPTAPDGTFYLIGREAIIVGTAPRSEVELAGHRARWLVQQGLLDVLEWLGEKPIPEQPVTGQQMLDRLAAGG